MSFGGKTILALCLGMVLVIGLLGCESPKPQAVQPVKIADGEIDPAVWGKAWPAEYDTWKKTSEPVATRRSKY